MHRLVVQAKAELEIAEAIDCYQRQNAAKAREFAEAIDRTLIAIQQNPYQFQAIEDDIRRAVLQSFLYWVVYLVRPSAVVVVSCFHTSRRPETWRARTP